MYLGIYFLLQFPVVFSPSGQPEFDHARTGQIGQSNMWWQGFFQICDAICQPGLTDTGGHQVAVHDDREFQSLLQNGHDLLCEHTSHLKWHTRHREYQTAILFKQHARSCSVSVRHHRAHIRH